MQSTDQATDAGSVARAYFEAVAARDLDAMVGFYEPGGTGEIHGLVTLVAPDTYRAWFANLFAAFPDFRFEILDVVAEGEKAAVRWRATGTFDGDTRFEGMEPTGAKVDVSGCDLVTIRNGKIHRNDAYMNSAQMAQQLGALPSPGSPAERLTLAAFNMKTRVSRALRR
ncbi:MAG TPA: ester cyclase [Solirubrobacterales bacterium]